MLDKEVIHVWGKPNMSSYCQEAHKSQTFNIWSQLNIHIYLTVPICSSYLCKIFFWNAPSPFNTQLQWSAGIWDIGTLNEHAFDKNAILRSRQNAFDRFLIPAPLEKVWRVRVREKRSNREWDLKKNTKINRISVCVSTTLQSFNENNLARKAFHLHWPPKETHVSLFLYSKSLENHLAWTGLHSMSKLNYINYSKGWNPFSSSAHKCFHCLLVGQFEEWRHLREQGRQIPPFSLKSSRIL